ncbi:MAG TPA: lipoyl(octanoyl) transferase LipB [Humidesulfovibrio sp.]|uniref:lipoyl(octanoyl) transferase LipB n=1 Tax=Humidesulfovibrio sp. TaxID=2910988 RepID=UPI002B7881AA|nr:lipoyl(octanoyl) transferase LipB [Humidesulfovibrio sp.]HWR04365.1 lipoyl(octanoyl) transferase LipB [Humidesulfovibrio sp.]
MRIEDLGLISYREAEALQLATLADVQQGGEEVLYLLEHPKVITLGRQGGGENLHVGRAYLESQGIELAQTLRGGNITCHFPGQLVAYPIFRVEKRPGGIRQFFFDMEEAVIRTCAAFGVDVTRRQGYPGVWTSPDGPQQSDASAHKICSMGIGVKRFVTYHGLALNVGHDVSLFDLITLCGIGGAKATSMSAEAGRPADQPIDIKEVKDVLAREFRARFAHSALAAGEAAQ